MKKLAPRVLDKEFQDVLTQLETTNDHYFVTGRAGSGKSTLLNIFTSTTRKRCVILAPTGIAALNVGGQTIHSFFRFPPKLLHSKDIRKLQNHWIYKKMDVMIIDEISMVRADMLDNIDMFLRKNRGIDLPFGGVQLIAFGDLFQLPPVVQSGFERHYFNSAYSSPYFFSSKVIENQWIDLHMIELQKVYRQTEKFFIKLLDRIRLRTLDMEDLESINERYEPNALSDPEDLYITLCSINATAQAVNQKRLNQLQTGSHYFKGKVSGDFSSRVFPTDQILELREGAQVMFVKNDINKRFVNGSLGKILKIRDDEITVLVKDQGNEATIVLEQFEWEIIKYKVDQNNPDRFSSEVVGTFTQYPIKLAWAITIHKSQGKTFDKIRVDLGRGAFEYGQTYVALSRCRTLDGITLSQKIRPKDIRVDPRIVEFYELKSRYW